MISIVKIGAAAGMMCALLGCGSPGNTYYVLNPTGPAKVTSVGRSSPIHTLAIDGVSIPGALDRPQLVVGLDENRVDVREYDRWAEPLDGMIRRTLAENLMARLGPDRVLETPNKDSSRLTITIDAFGREGQRVVLRGQWTLKDSGTDSPAPAPHSFDRDLPLDQNAQLPGAVAGMSQLLGAVSDDIASTIGGR
jgi:uncharacterized lipoprotein YmbA